MKDKSGRKRNGTGMLLLNKDSAYGLRSETERENYFWPPLAMFFYLSFSYFSTLSRFSFSRLCPITDDSWPFFRVHSREEESQEERRKERSSREKNSGGRKKEVEDGGEIESS